MTNKSCLYQIHEQLLDMSAKERCVAEYILASPQESVHPSIEELAERIGVSESTLFRFVRKLGYGGYQQFRIALATESVDPHRTIYETDIEAIDEGSAMALVFRTNIAALERTMAMIAPEDIGRAADLLVNAKRLYFFGLGGSALVAQDAYHKLVRTGLLCAAPQDFHMQLMQAAQLEVGDTALLVSHTGVNKDALAVADAVKQTGATLLVMTNQGRSPLSKTADLSLFVHTRGSPYATEAFSARIVQMALIDCLYVSVMEKLGDKGHERLERMRQVIARRRT